VLLIKIKSWRVGYGRYLQRQGQGVGGEGGGGRQPKGGGGGFACSSNVVGFYGHYLQWHVRHYNCVLCTPPPPAQTTHLYSCFLRALAP